MIIAAYDKEGRLVATYRPEDGEDLDELVTTDGLRFVESVNPSEHAEITHLSGHPFDQVWIVEHVFTPDSWLRGDGPKDPDEPVQYVRNEGSGLATSIRVRHEDGHESLNNPLIVYPMINEED